MEDCAVSIIRMVEGRKRRARYRKWLRAGGYWANACRTKNGKPVYRWYWVLPRSAKRRPETP